MVLTEEIIIEQLKMILDPDIGIDIWTMGLIYDIHIREHTIVDITMTFSTPFCPAAPVLQEQIRDQLESVGAQHVTMTVTFDPPWKPSDELRAILGL